MANATMSVEKRIAAPAPPAAPAEDILEGLTLEDCAAACTPECCVITGRRLVRFEHQTRDAMGVNMITTYEEAYTTYCGHPNKSGLSPRDKMDTILAR